jgi:integrase
LVRPPRFEPGSPAWEADVLDQARLRPLSDGLWTNILNLLINLRSRGLSENTLRDVSAKLKFLANYVDLNDSEAVNTFISSLGCSGAYKHNLVKTYAYYVRSYNLEWNRPRYRFERSPIRIPSEQEVNSIIENSSRRYSVIFTLLKETGAMPYELSKILMEDIDLDKGLLSVKGFKGHASRIFKLKSQTLTLLKWYIKQYGNNKPLFPRSDCIGKTWRRARSYTAK